MRKIKILKFGGNLLRTISDRKAIAKVITEERKNGFDIVVVVSAIGRFGDPYATDTLLTHINKGVLSERETALITSCGEVISSVVLSSHLNSRGIKASALTGAEAGIRTSNDYLNSQILSVDRKIIDNLINEGITPIVTGYQGKSIIHGKKTILSRGGSDITAAAISQTFNAYELDIYTDVPGIMTTDPKIANSAKTLKHLNYEQALKIASSGGKVIHPEAIEWVREKNIKIKIKSLYSIEETVISNNTDIKQAAGSIFCLTTSPMDDNTGKITIIGNKLESNQDIRSYISNHMHIQSFSLDYDKIELILPKNDINKCIKAFHKNFIENAL